MVKTSQVDCETDVDAQVPLTCVRVKQSVSNTVSSGAAGRQALAYPSP